MEKPPTERPCGDSSGCPTCHGSAPRIAEGHQPPEDRQRVQAAPEGVAADRVEDQVDAPAAGRAADLRRRSPPENTSS